jgi:hypothetical protein
MGSSAFGIWSRLRCKWATYDKNHREEWRVASKNAGKFCNARLHLQSSRTYLLRKEIWFGRTSTSFQWCCHRQRWCEFLRAGERHIDVRHGLFDVHLLSVTKFYWFICESNGSYRTKRGARESQAGSRIFRFGMSVRKDEWQTEAQRQELRQRSQSQRKGTAKTKTSSSS